MKIIASKSLLNKTSKPKKPQSQLKSKKSSKNTRYLYEVGEADLVYLGSVIENQNKKKCKVIGRSRNHIQCTYKVEFENGEILECIPDVIMYMSDYKDQLAEAENNIDDIDDANEISLEEQKILSLGLEPHKNRFSCLNPDFIASMRCEQCGYENRCIYIKKFKYNKLKF